MDNLIDNNILNSLAKCGEIFYDNDFSKILIKCLICKPENFDFIDSITRFQSKTVFQDHIFQHFENLVQPIENQSITSNDDLNDKIKIELFEFPEIDINNVSNSELEDMNSVANDIEVDDLFKEIKTLVDDEENVSQINNKMDLKGRYSKTSGGKYVCLNCNKEFNYNGIYKHVRYNRCIAEAGPKIKIYKNKKYLFLTSDKSKCLECDKEFTKYNILRHLRNVNCNPNTQKSIDFNTCEYKKHMRIPTIKSEDGFYHCTECEHKSKAKSNIRQHINTHIPATTCKCTICGKLYASEKSLKEHLKIHFGIKEYKCEYCGKEFVNQSNYKVHIRVHTQEKRYSCDYCDKRFVSSNEKKDHEKAIHLNERNFVCEFCSKRFIKHYKLKQHLRRHQNIRPAKCDMCDKAFYTNYDLKLHKETHLENRVLRYKCNVCGKAFGQGSTLRSHKLLHSEIKQYVCKICDQRFSQHAGLYSHLKTFHKVEKEGPREIPDV